ncbi:hypothetical protein KHA90_11465 [Flavobacterium psychroterrae]|jgi:hypothetical protein|uniref:Uncharacterized protein n=1 Tax=Flavobacterium psychroterrae TaxID=2133767 RepID=A0ABS5PBI0_9FLAO|nr:hypothetical protein [Flavobacterium psychroterrae]MBS7231643.1 hypothetical protein [Flavobacterium psychroterrae]
MKNLFVTIAMIGIVSFATAQETPKSKKSKTQSDTIVNNRTKTEKKSTTHKSETHTNPTTSKKKSTTTTTRKDTVSTSPTTPN